ncbi:MAG TPA: peptidoglycan DD-metalloendopeptidase family protein [Myxococcota bacterium]|nr:peptidoglycan DD-metalloendopeptidase family protein [Myxococcota bacterium]HRY93170.1 peptidoglycan DD-metalloendopeptidase family protein [Myxococcota bacterium]HSA21675.1 peptidoglycan DD-metalloendopeptidase family protein [Myxococcota bacterium]
MSPRPPRAAPLVACLGLWLGLAPCARPADDHPIRDDLRAVGRDLVREQRLLEALRAESRGLLQTLDGLDQELGSAQEALGEAGRKQAHLEAELGELQAGRAEAERGVVEARVRLRARLRRLYMLGEVGWLNLIFAAATPLEVLERYQLVSRLARADAGLVSDLERHQALLADSERQLAEQKARLEALATEMRARERRTSQARAEKLRALELVNEQRALHERAQRELKAARGRLARLVSAIEGQPRAADSSKGFASWRGRLPAPVAGGRVEVAFGRQVDERFGTVTLARGVDVRAPAGAPVRAVYPGLVAFADVFEGYGRLVILEHGGGYFTLYAHLEGFAVKKGERVEQGQPVGRLGDSGSLKGAFLYFEVRQGGRAVDPGAWVRLEGKP